MWFQSMLHYFWVYNSNFYGFSINAKSFCLVKRAMGQYWICVLNNRSHYCQKRSALNLCKANKTQWGAKQKKWKEKNMSIRAWKKVSLAHQRIKWICVVVFEQYAETQHKSAWCGGFLLCCTYKCIMCHDNKDSTVFSPFHHDDFVPFF